MNGKDWFGLTAIVLIVACGFCFIVSRMAGCNEVGWKYWYERPAQNEKQSPPGPHTN